MSSSNVNRVDLLLAHLAFFPRSPVSERASYLTGRQRLKAKPLDSRSTDIGCVGLPCFLQKRNSISYCWFGFEVPTKTSGRISMKRNFKHLTNPYTLNLAWHMRCFFRER